MGQKNPPTVGDRDGSRTSRTTRTEPTPLALILSRHGVHVEPSGEKAEADALLADFRREMSRTRAAPGRRPLSAVVWDGLVGIAEAQHRAGDLARLQQALTDLLALARGDVWAEPR